MSATEQIHNFESILYDIVKMGIKPKDVILVHSSIKSVGNVEGGAETILDALIESVKDGMLILPSHTWASVNEQHDIFDPDKETACVGILSNLFIKRKGVKRSLHPTHSVAAVGKNATEYASGEENQTTPCSRNGCYGKLYDMHAKILLIGCGLNRNTYMHGVEEWFGIKERLTDSLMQLKIVMPDRTLKECNMRKHYKPEGISISEYYAKMEKPLMERNLLHKGRIGDAECMIMDATGTADLFTEFLRKDRNIFTNHKEIPEEYYR